MVAKSIQSLSRRSFLTATAAAAISAGIAGCGELLYTRRTADARPGIGRRAWRELQERISGPVLRPWDEKFAWITLPNNLRYSGAIPQGVARCRNANDVAQSILWARERDLPLGARSGGHSYAGYSTTDGLMIETTLMCAAKYDGSTGMVTVEGGALNSAVYDALRTENVAITHGRCPSVGVAGFLLGGGLGFVGNESGELGDVAGSVRRARVYAGHSGWGPGQLEGELEEESWIVDPDPTRDEIFSLDAEGLWSAVLRRKGREYALLSTMPPDPSVN